MTTSDTSNTENLAIARELYRAFSASDGAGLFGLLHPAFVGEVSAGMPFGVGGHIEGPAAMLEKVWGPVFMKFDVAPIPDELVASTDGRVFAVGHYRGRARKGGELDAAFVHVLSFADGRVVSLVQVTDTAKWIAAASTS